jgi:hypothetical protein
MSNSTFDTVETTLKNLRDIVDRIHLQSAETSRLVEDMELLIAEMKTKAPKAGNVESAPVSINKPVMLAL